MDNYQKEAVYNIEGPMLIVAGPGSGKTRTLINRANYMIKEKGILEEEILLATFTERAARELLTRLSEININKMYIGTIHSICQRLLDENIEKTFLRRGFKVLDAVDQKFFIYKNIKHFKKINGYENFMKDKKIFTDWQQARSLQTWLNLMGEAHSDFSNSEEKEIELLKNVYQLYRQLLILENSIDFTGIQEETYNLLTNYPGVLEKVRETIKYLMIDEYQDTNSIQAEIMFLIAGERENICVVGDDDQALYRFRGAVVENILNFEKNLKKPCKKVKLTINYRSHEDIVKFTNAWIHGIKWDNYRLDKDMKPFHKKNNKTHKVLKITGKNESQWCEEVLFFLKSLIKNGKISDYNQVAFLFYSIRSKRAKMLAEFLLKNGINVYSPRANLFFEREEVRVVMGAYFTLFKKYALERDEDYIMRSIYILGKKIGDEKKTFEEWCLKERKQISFLEIFYELLQFEFIKKYFNEEKMDILSNREMSNFGKITELFQKLDIFLNLKNLNEEQLDRALKYIFKYHFQHLLSSQIDEYEDIKEYAPKGAVSFFTFHQSKGLEFPVVIVGSMEGSPKNNLDEEWEKELKSKLIGTVSKEPLYRVDEFDFWRAYYVAFSRAQELLVLTGVENRKSKIPSPSYALAPFYDRLQEWRDSNLWNSDEVFSPTKQVNIKNIFSLTGHIFAYENCPKKYRFFSNFGFCEIKREDYLIGTLLHEFIENINKGIIPTDLEKEFENNCKTLERTWGIVVNHERKLKAFLQLKNYLKDENEILNNIVEVEASFMVSKEEYIIEGRIDLVFEKNGEIHILDYKSGNKNENAKYFDEYRRQLELYAYLYEKTSNKKVSKLHIYFLAEENDPIYSFENTSENIENTLEKFNTIAEKILNKEFLEKRETEECKRCELMYYCDRYLDKLPKEY
jgi:DNA helicase-2/ATP-dependent DNA helicase PcrA